MSEMQVTQATITPKCREKGDPEAVRIALKEIEQKLLFAMSASVNDQATFTVKATVAR